MPQPFSGPHMDTAFPGLQRYIIFNKSGSRTDFSSERLPGFHKRSYGILSSQPDDEVATPPNTPSPPVMFV